MSLKHVHYPRAACTCAQRARDESACSGGGTGRGGGLRRTLPHRTRRHHPREQARTAREAHLPYSPVEIPVLVFCHLDPSSLLKVIYQHRLLDVSDPLHFSCHNPGRQCLMRAINIDASPPTRLKESSACREQTAPPRAPSPLQRLSAWARSPQHAPGGPCHI